MFRKHFERQKGEGLYYRIEKKFKKQVTKLCMQHNLTCLQVEGKMTIRKNAKMLTVFAVSLLGMRFRFVCSLLLLS